ncbi:MAG: universal stress protein [Candidatus Ranarchaeia archaeon]
MFPKILIGFDGSEPAKKALDLSLKLANAFGSELTLASIVEQFIIPSQEGFVLPAIDIMQKARLEIQKLVKKTLENIKKEHPNLKVHGMIKEGRPSDTLVKIAKEEKFDLIVLGHCGHGGLRERLLGSTTHYISNHASCPVLIVR